MDQLHVFTCIAVASQMMTLIRLFPFLIGQCIEHDDHWDGYLLLLAIADMVCAFEVLPDDPAKLAWLVQMYLKSFISLYSPEYSIVSKMHYMVHLPQQMIT